MESMICPAFPALPLPAGGWARRPTTPGDVNFLSFPLFPPASTYPSAGISWNAQSAALRAPVVRSFSPTTDSFRHGSQKKPPRPVIRQRPGSFMFSRSTRDATYSRRLGLLDVTFRGYWLLRPYVRPKTPPHPHLFNLSRKPSVNRSELLALPRLFLCQPLSLCIF